MTLSDSSDVLTTATCRLLSNVLLKNTSDCHFECIEELLTTWVSTHPNAMDLPTLQYTTESPGPEKQKQHMPSLKESMEKTIFGATQENGGGITTNNSNLSSLTSSRDRSSSGDSS